jgi:hypothetical protein
MSVPMHVRANAPWCARPRSAPSPTRQPRERQATNHHHPKQQNDANQPFKTSIHKLYARPVPALHLPRDCWRVAPKEIAFAHLRRVVATSAKAARPTAHSCAACPTCRVARQMTSSMRSMMMMTMRLMMRQQIARGDRSVRDATFAKEVNDDVGDCKESVVGCAHAPRPALGVGRDAVHENIDGKVEKKGKFGFVVDELLAMRAVG